MGHFAIDESNGVKTLEIEKDRNSYDIMIMMAYKRSTVQFFFFFFWKAGNDIFNRAWFC